MSNPTTVTYRAAEWNGSDFRVSAFPVAEPGPGEVRVRVVACTVCMTEVHAIDGYYDWGFPPVMGHEYGGVVEAVGPGVESPAVGTNVGCWAANGGFGEVVVAPADAFRTLPPDLPVEYGAFLEPVTACVFAVQRGRVPLGGSVLVTGAGSNGLLFLQLARRAGAARVVVSEPDAHRRALALELGADEAIDPTATPVGDLGVDVAFESSGNPRGLEDCLGTVTSGGRVVMFGVMSDTATIELPLFAFHLRNTELIAAVGKPEEAIKAAIALLPSLDLEPLVSHRFGLDDVAAAFEAARSGAGLKVLVDVSASGA